MAALVFLEEHVVQLLDVGMRQLLEHLHLAQQHLDLLVVQVGLVDHLDGEPILLVAVLPARVHLALVPHAEQLPDRVDVREARP